MLFKSVAFLNVFPASQIISFLLVIPDKLKGVICIRLKPLSNFKLAFDFISVLSVLDKLADLIHCLSVFVTDKEAALSVLLHTNIIAGDKGNVNAIA